MQIILYDKGNYKKQFVYNYLPLYIRDYVLNSLSNNKLRLLNSEFNINSKEIIKEALNSLHISETPNTYVIAIDKNKRYKNENLSSLINLITYGNRSCKGYNIVYDAFNTIASKIDIIYKEWLDGS